MNLWVNRIGQLLTLAFALFFLSCQEEVSVLGFKNPNSKYNVSYIELPIASSVMLRDSLRTTNFTFIQEPNRFLLGSYDDDLFGTVSSTFVTQYYRVSSSLNSAKISTSAVYDSITLQLQFDLYSYGSKSKTPQEISIHELGKELTYDSLRGYYNRSSAPVAELIGSKTFTIDPEDFEEFAKSSTSSDTIITIKVPLDHSFGERIFNSAARYRDDTDPSYDSLNLFIKEFKGLVIKSVSGDKIVGFAPTGAQTRMIVHYHQDNADSLALVLSFGGLNGYNRITSDKNGTELSAVVQPYKDYLQESDKRYIQSGIGILTKLDFSSFYNFIDTIPNLLINSAELAIESIEPSALAPPKALVLRVLNNNNNYFKKLSSVKDTAELKYYNGQLTDNVLTYDVAGQQSPALVDDDGVFYAVGDREARVLRYSQSRNSYNMVMALFLQQLSVRTDERTNFRNFVLYPASEAFNAAAFQSGAKSVDRVVFPASGIKLKIYYTKPLTQQQ